MTDTDEIYLIAGSGSSKLGEKIASRLGVPLRPGEVRRFSDGNLFVKVGENVRERDVFLVQSTVFPSNDNFMELLFLDRRTEARQRQNCDRGNPVFRLRKGRQKG